MNGIKLNEYIPSIEFNMEEGERKPFITFDRAASAFVLDNDTLSYITEAGGNIGFVVMCGDKGSGKSTLMNLAMGIPENRGFQQNSQGISIWTKPIFKDSTETHIYLLDMQGYDGSDDSGDWVDLRYSCLAFLLSSIVLYNNSGPITEKSIGKLKLISSLSRILSVAEDDVPGDYSLSYYAPRFIWLLRDVTDDSLTIDGNLLSADDYLETRLTETSDGNREAPIQNMQIRQSILNCLKDRECIDFPYPTNEPIRGKLDPNGLNQRFHSQVLKLRERILSRFQPKQIDGIIFSASMMSCYLSTIIYSLNEKNKQHILDIWDDVIETESVVTYNRAWAQYNENLHAHFEHHSEPYSANELNRIMKDIREQSMEEFSMCAFIKDSDEEFYENYFSSLKKKIDEKEANILSLNDELCKDKNTEILNDLISPLNVAIEYGEFDNENISKIGNQLEKIYDIYIEKSFGPNNTTHFLEIMKGQNESLFESFVRNTRKNLSAKKDLNPNADNDHSHKIMKTNELQVDIEKKQQEYHNLKVAIENQEQSKEKCIEDIDAIQDKINREQSDITEKEKDIQNVTKSIEEQENQEKLLKEAIGNLEKKKKNCVIF